MKLRNTYKLDERKIYLKKDFRNLSDIGDILTLRKDAKLTQEKVAKHCGVSVQAYQRWEHGVSKQIEVDKFKKLQEILGV